jgi:hypothetical protein
LVNLLALFSGMGFAIAFNDQVGFSTEKVTDVIPELMLAPELGICQLSITKQFPKKCFRIRLLLPKLPGTFFQSTEIKTATTMSSSTFGRGLG